MQDQGQSGFLQDDCDTPNEKSDQDDDKIFMNYEVAQITEKANNVEKAVTEAVYDDMVDKSAAGYPAAAKMKSEIDNRSSIFNSQGKCSSIQSKQAQSAKTGGVEQNDPSAAYKNNMQVGSTEKTLLAATETKNTTSKTSAFQRLVMASKRMMQKKSSAKKDAAVRSNRLVNSSNSMAAEQTQSKNYSTQQQQSAITDTMNIMKEQTQQVEQTAIDSNKAIFAQPFRVGSRKQQHRGSTATAPATADSNQI